MKKIMLYATMLTLAILFSAQSAIAQINTPAPSPFCKMEQKIGLTDVTIEYSRPSQKGRELFVDVEKWGKPWRTGANSSTKITFGDDVKVEGQEVPAGTYALYSIPDPTNWTIMLYKDTKLGGNMAKYDEAQEQARFKVKTQKLPISTETFTINLANVKNNTADIALMWGNYYVPFKVEVEVDSKVMKQIETAMNGTSRGEYYVAARYYYDNDKEMDKALTWVKKANEIDAKFWQMRLQALILGKMGRYDDAIAAANKSTAMAEEAQNADYPIMNKKSIAEWTAMKAKGGKKTMKTEKMK